MGACQTKKHKGIKVRTIAVVSLEIIKGRNTGATFLILYVPQIAFKHESEIYLYRAERMNLQQTYTITDIKGGPLGRSEMVSVDIGKYTKEKKCI